jgi:hypothetical protein
VLKPIISITLVLWFAFLHASAQEAVTPWRNDPMFQRLATALDPVPAIDMTADDSRHSPMVTFSSAQAIQR